MDMAHNQINAPDGLLPLKDTATSLSLPPFDYRGIERRVAELRHLPAPDWQEYHPAGAGLLLADDGTAATPALANTLLADGWRVAILRLPDGGISAGAQVAKTGAQPAPSIPLPDLSEASIARALEAAVRQIGGLGGYVFLCPANPTPAQARAWVKFNFLMAKHLKPYLAGNTAAERPAFMAVTRLDGALGTQEVSETGAVVGGLFGLVKTLALEWDGVFCRALDLAPELSPEQAAAQVLAELHDPNRLLTEVGYGGNGQGRVTLVATDPASAVFRASQVAQHAEIAH